MRLATTIRPPAALICPTIPPVTPGCTLSASFSSLAEASTTSWSRSTPASRKLFATGFSHVSGSFEHLREAPEFLADGFRFPHKRLKHPVLGTLGAFRADPVDSS